MADTWFDGDGLLRKYGPTRTVANLGGEYRTYGRLHEVEVKIDLTALTQTETIQSDVTVIPSGVIIQEVEINTKTAAATGVAIDLGLIKLDRTTEVDYDGLLAAFPTASMNAAGEKNIISDNTTYDGALIGAVTAYPSFVSCSATTATAFTAGYIVVTIRYWKP
jgi:hypothetical protein